ncbi:MAG: ribosomal protein S18-alanine N-acetyltransferase [Clostridia bacterium]|nr:ribosomal protein S18-alanine N-acetyltransferase [Clostridia bacterium]
MLFEKGFFSEFSINPIMQRHISGIAKLEKVCFDEPWSAEALFESYKRGTKFFVAENAEHIMGYIGFSAVAGEGYITNVAVFPKYRRMGVATALLEKAKGYGKENRLEFLSLEVRKSNYAAISLYEKEGFVACGERKNFYTNPKEDAIIMTVWFNKE